MQRHLLDPVGSSSVPRVVGRLCGVQGARRVVCQARGPRSAPEVAARLDRPRPVPGTPGQDLGHAGHAPPAHTRGGRNFLSLMAFGRSWEKPSWQRYFGVTTKQVDKLRHVVREAPDGTVLTREELVAAVVAKRGLGHVGQALRSGWGGALLPPACSSRAASCIRSATAWARGRCRSCSARSICASIREPHAAVVSSALLDRAAATTSPFDAAAGQP
jgi:hypothetical protein